MGNCFFPSDCLQEAKLRDAQIGPSRFIFVKLRDEASGTSQIRTKAREHWSFSERSVVPISRIGHATLRICLDSGAGQQLAGVDSPSACIYMQLRRVVGRSLSEIGHIIGSRASTRRPSMKVEALFGLS